MMPPPKKTCYIDKVESITLHPGDVIEVGSMSVPVRPPYLMLESFVQCPGIAEVLGESRPAGEGTHQASYRIRGLSRGEGELTIGFKDMDTRKVTHQKSVKIKVE